MPRAQIDQFTFTSWNGDEMEPATRQIAVLEAPPRMNGRAFVLGSLQTPPVGTIITGVDAGITDTLAQQLAESYRTLQKAGVGVTVYNSMGKRFDDVMIIAVRCFPHYNSATGLYRVQARWSLDVAVEAD